jgi:hypothetical protein
MGSAGSGSGSGSIAAARSHAASSVLHAHSFSRQRAGDARMVPSSSIAGSLHEWLPGSAGGGEPLFRAPVRCFDVDHYLMPTAMGMAIEYMESIVLLKSPS